MICRGGTIGGSAEGTDLIVGVITRMRGGGGGRVGEGEGLRECEGLVGAA